MVRIGTEHQRKSRDVNRARAKEMRHKPVQFEKLIWSELRNRKCGFKFKRQVLIGKFIADFVCQEHKLIVELDGPFHKGRVSYDAARDKFLESQGYKVLRFTNEETGWDVAMTLHIILQELRQPPLTLPSPPKGERINMGYNEPILRTLIANSHQTHGGSAMIRWFETLRLFP